MKTNSENELNLFFWDNQLVEVIEVREKEILSSTDIMALRYAAMELIDFYKEIFIPNIGREEVENHCCIQENALYFNNFAGYYFSKSQILSKLYMSIDNRIILSVYDSEEDDYTDYLVY